MAVAHDDAVKLLGIVHRATHHTRVLHAAAVIGKRDGTVSNHVPHLGEHLTFEPLRKRARHEHAAEADFGGLALHVFHDGRVIADGVRVRHRAHRGEAAVSRRLRLRLDVTFVLESGVTQVNVHVDQAGNDDFPRKVTLDALRHLKVVANLHDAAIADQDVSDLVEPNLGVEKPRVLKHQRHCRFLLTADRERPCGRARRNRPGPR